ncbi:MAG: DUF86 domain-containing protein [Planctomycetes bacterium]|nr:DUF86 domain-containing protein [Planctomycetota bacterium]
MSSRTGRERLNDILVAIEEIESFVGDLTRNEFLNDRKTIQAVVANFTVIGESANYIEDELKDCIDVPWHLMTGMRNRIVHGYFDVDPEVLWDTISNELPDVKSKVGSFLSGSRSPKIRGDEVT